MFVSATVLCGQLSASSCKIVLAYYADWNKPGYSASTIPYNKLTHICHAFVIPNANGTLNVGGGFLEPALISGAHAAGVKVLVSVGGASGSAYFSGIAATYRTAFANAVRDFILANNYDGVDIDWEFPGNATDRTNFNLMVQALRTTFTAAGHPEWLISGAFSSDLWQAPQYDLATLKNSLNFFNVMTYDYHGSWSSHMSHNAPLAPATGDPEGNLSTQNSINYYLGQGVPASQLIFGLPFYGYNFPVEDINNTCPGGNCGGATYTGYLQAAADVGAGWTRYWDASASSPYLRNNSTANTITYDDPQSIQIKSAWALNTANLGGVFMWELSQDYAGPGNQPLLDAMRSPLACGPTATPTFTRTRTRTVTPSVSATATVSASPSASRTSTPSVTLSPTPTRTATSTPTGTGTPTLTGTPSVTGTRTLSVTGTVSITATLSSTIGVPSLTDTPSFSPTSGGSASPTQVSTATVSGTRSPTLTPDIPSLTSTPWASTIPTSSPTATPDPSGTGTRTSSSTPASSASQTVSPTATFTATPTPLVILDTFTCTSTPNITPLATPGKSPDGGGPLVIERALPVPDPDPRRLSIRLSGGADEIELKVYSSASTAVAVQMSGPRAAGWSTLPLPAVILQKSSNGIWFYRIVARRGGAVSAARTGTMVLTR